MDKFVILEMALVAEQLATFRADHLVLGFLVTSQLVLEFESLLTLWTLVRPGDPFIHDNRNVGGPLIHCTFNGNIYFVRICHSEAVCKI